MKNILFKRNLLKRNPVLVTPSKARCSVLHDLIALNSFYNVTVSECVMVDRTAVQYCLLSAATDCTVTHYTGLSIAPSRTLD
jgi:hypothetical protein